jgi:DNA-directed RNA polymerase specialized sigma24 family protein
MPEHSAGHGPFPTTRHSVVAATRTADAEARDRAFGTLVEAYWRPVYKYIRVAHGVDAEDACDLTQEFFLRAIERDYFRSYDPNKALFRTFLRVCLDRFVANERKAARRLKRGGDVHTLPLEFECAEGELRAVDVPDRVTPEDYFHREWVRSLFGLAVEDLRAELEGTGKAVHFALFERCDLGPEGDARPSYAALGVEFAIPVSQVTNFLALARRGFRKAVLARLRALCGSDSEFRAEARALLGVEVP